MILFGVIEWLIALTYAMPCAMLVQSMSELRIIAAMVPAWFASVMLSVLAFNRPNHKAITIWLVVGNIVYAAVFEVLNHSKSVLLPIGPIIGTILLVRIMRVDEEHDRAQRMVRRFPLEFTFYGIYLTITLVIPSQHLIVPVSISIVAAIAYVCLRCTSFIIAQRKLYMTFSSALLFGGVLTAIGLVLLCWGPIIDALVPVLAVIGLPYYFLVDGLLNLINAGNHVPSQADVAAGFVFLVVIVSTFIYFSVKRAKMNIALKKKRWLSSHVLARIIGLLCILLTPWLIRNMVPPKYQEHVMNTLHPLKRASSGSPTTSGTFSSTSSFWIALAFVIFIIAFALLLRFMRRRLPYAASIYRVGLGAPKDKEIHWMSTTSPVRQSYQTFLQRLVSKGINLSESDTTRSVEERAYRTGSEKQSLIARLTRLYEIARYGEQETSDMAKLADGITKQMKDDVTNPER